jgi:hypothetical protein
MYIAAIMDTAPVKVVWRPVDSWGMYAGRVRTTGSEARWARGLAVAVLTAPGVLLAQLAVSGVLPSWRSALVVWAAVAVVACAVRTRTAAGTAAVAAVAQVVGHAVVALTVPHAASQQGCLAVVGRGADLGVRYALVRGDACPPGSAATAPALAAVLSAVAAAVVVLLGHALLAALTGVLVAALAAGTDLAARLADAVLPALALLLGVRPAPAGSPVPPLPEPPALIDRHRSRGPRRRGPPAFSAA